MITLNEMVDKLVDLQKTINSIGVTGVANAANVVKAYDICECILDGLHESIVEIQNQNEKVGEDNGEFISDSEST